MAGGRHPRRGPLPTRSCRTLSGGEVGVEKKAPSGHPHSPPPLPRPASPIHQRRSVRRLPHAHRGHSAAAVTLRHTDGRRPPVPPPRRCEGHPQSWLRWARWWSRLWAGGGGHGSACRVHQRPFVFSFSVHHFTARQSLPVRGRRPARNAREACPPTHQQQATPSAVVSNPNTSWVHAGALMRPVEGGGVRARVETFSNMILIRFSLEHDKPLPRASGEGTFVSGVAKRTRNTRIASVLF